MTIRYRNDIDGLRALAVLAVVLFHLGDSPLTGGFTGVDVFFVISGYLITSIIVKDIEQRRFSIWQFYEKRVRRLFPALFAVVVVSTALAYWLFLPDVFQDYGQSVVASVSYLSNVYFFLTNDYFSGAAELKPLLHTWSLAVEEQFYLIYPVAIATLMKWRVNWLKPVVLVGMTALFVCTVCGMSLNKSAMFYLAPFRFWELLAGAAIALYPVPLKRSPIAINLLWLLSIITIIASFFWLDRSVSFPGIGALPAVIGAACAIALGAHSTWAQAILGNRALSWIGKISYSLYLWHWPIVVFYGYWHITPISSLEKLMLLAVTFAVSWLSWRYIEQPLRQSSHATSKPIPAFVTTGVLSVLILVVGLSIHFTQGYPNRFDIDMAKLSIEPSKKVGRKGCFLDNNHFYIDWAGAASCTYLHPNATKTVLVWGDSHAQHLLKGLLHYQSELNVNIMMYNSAGCSPMFDTDIPNNPQCRANNNNVRSILANNTIDHVIMAGNWAWAYKIKQDEIDLSPVKRTVDELQSMGLSVQVFNQVPIYSIRNPQLLAIRLAQKQTPPTEYALPSYYGDAAASELKRLLDPNVLVRAHDFMCHEGMCEIVRGGNLMVTDEAHLSSAGSIEMVSLLINND